MVAWLAAGAAAVAAATAGVAMVSDQVTESRPAPLDAAQVADELASQTQATAGAATTTTSTADAAAPPATTPPSTTPPAPTTTAPSPPTTASPAVLRTYTLVGGTATLRFTSSGVTVVTASPNAGFDVEVEPEHGNGVKVEFERSGHKSRVSGWWEGGPRDDVREEVDD